MAERSRDDSVVRVGPYLVQDVIGQGPHGTVFAVLHEQRRQRLTLKRLHEPAKGRPGRTFNRIVRVVVALSHPAIADVSHVALHGEHVAIIGEVVAGRSLADVIAEEGALDPYETVGLARQLCIGLMYAHQRCVYHTSLRPENVFLMSDGSVRITDFAIAALYGNSVRRRPPYTARHAVFFAPEFREKGVIHPPSDIYSLGVLLYSVLAGGVPLTAAGAEAGDGRFSYLEVGAEAPEKVQPQALDMSHLPEATPPRLRSAIAAAIAPQVSDRPGSINAFADMLKGTPTRSSLSRLAREEVQDEDRIPAAPGPSVRVCPACRRPVSPAGRVCLACGLVLREVLEEDESIDYFQNHGRRLLAKRDLAAAERAYRRAIDRKPRQAQLHNELGDVLAVGNRFDEAVTEYREAVQLDPGADDAWHDLGVSLAALGRRREARQALERAVELTDRDELRLSARIHLGAIAAEEGRVQEAIDIWEEVLRDDPGLIPVRMALASAYASHSRYEQAEQHLRAVLSIEPGMREAENLLSRVRERQQLERQDVDTSFGLMDDVGGGTAYIGPGFSWVRLIR
ncbi:MAG: protein kinase [Armatimonadota bacterium]|nr:protein kinase [Armatimonadota bacterium]